MVSCVSLLCLPVYFDQLILACHGGRGPYKMDLLVHSPQLFIYSILPSSSPAQHFNPPRTNREIKKQRMRHDERGSQWSAECGQVKRREALRTVVSRRGGWRFLISEGPLLHFLEHDAVFHGGKVRLVREKKNMLWVQHLLFILLLQPLVCLSLSCVLKGKTHLNAGFGIYKFYLYSIAIKSKNVRMK